MQFSRCRTNGPSPFEEGDLGSKIGENPRLRSNLNPLSEDGGRDSLTTKQYARIPVPTDRQSPNCVVSDIRIAS